MAHQQKYQQEVARLYSESHKLGNDLSRFLSGLISEGRTIQQVMLIPTSAANVKTLADGQSITETETLVLMSNPSLPVYADEKDDDDQEDEDWQDGEEELKLKLDDATDTILKMDARYTQLHRREARLQKAAESVLDLLDAQTIARSPELKEAVLQLKTASLRSTGAKDKDVEKEVPEWWQKKVKEVGQWATNL